MDRGASWGYSPWGRKRVGPDLVTKQHQQMLHVSVVVPFYHRVVFQMEHSLFILSLDDGHLGCFQFGIVMYKATMSALIQISVWVFIFYCMLYFFF